MKDPNCIQCREWELCPFHASEEKTPEKHAREESKCRECKSFPCSGTTVRCSLEKYASDRGKTVAQLLFEKPELESWFDASEFLRNYWRELDEQWFKPDDNSQFVISFTNSALANFNGNI